MRIKIFVNRLNTEANREIAASLQKQARQGPGFHLFKSETSKGTVYLVYSAHRFDTEPFRYDLRYYGVGVEIEYENQEEEKEGATYE